jgi:hypothetical protein
MEEGLENLKIVVEKQKATMEETQKYFHELRKGEPSLERDQEIKEKVKGI